MKERAREGISFSSRLRGSDMKIERYKGGRFWAIYDSKGELVAVVVYERGAQEIVRRLSHNESTSSKG